MWDELDDERAVKWVKEFIDSEAPNTPQPRRVSADMTSREMETSVARAPSHANEADWEMSTDREGTAAVGVDTEEFVDERAPERRRSVPGTDPAREEMIRQNPELVKILIKQTGIFHELGGEEESKGN